MAQLFTLLRDVLTTQYDRLRHLARYRRNPALYVALGLIAVLTTWRLFNGVPVEELLTEHYIETMLILAGGIITRLQVWSPESVEDLVATQQAYPAPEDSVFFDPNLISNTTPDTNADGQDSGPATREG